MSVRQISAHEAVVKTATVEVKSLTISGKQVTLAVFRQLIDADIVDEPDNETTLPVLVGHPWGTVNYHPDKCADAGKHLHVVWQDNDHLRRARVDWKLPGWSESWADSIEDTRYLAVLRQIEETGEGQVFDVLPRYRYGIQAGSMRVTFMDSQRREDAAKFVKSFSAPKYEGQRFQDLHRGKWYEDPAALRGEILDDAVRTVESAAKSLNASDTWALANKEQGLLSAAQAKYRALYGELEALDQLFIAV